ncbi:hypothetical protein KC947_01345 [Candidatus Saccharibacteria bacterium]|nr:hypothetical protein [Candidatus Saccharibacteria bacterium]
MIRNLRRNVGGFTILETIIVLTVMSALLASALLLFQQRIPKTQFQKSLNELVSQMTDISNQVATGYYPRTTDYNCSSGVIDTSDTSDQGENASCIFIGQAVKFGSDGCTNPGNECDKLKVYTIFGSRLNSSGQIASSMTDARAKISSDFGTQEYTNSFGLSVEKVKVGSDNYGGVAYVQSFGSSLGGGSLNGATQVAISPVGQYSNVSESNINFESHNFGFSSAELNPSSGILLCVKSGTTNQYALVTLGANGNAMNVEKQIVNKSDWDTKCS